jgi:hypothetical protein
MEQSEIQAGVGAVSDAVLVVSTPTPTLASLAIAEAPLRRS